MVPVLVVEIVPAFVVEMVPVLVVEMVPAFAKVGTETAIINRAAQTISLTFFIALLLVIRNSIQGTWVDMIFDLLGPTSGRLIKDYCSVFCFTKNVPETKASLKFTLSHSVIKC